MPAGNPPREVIAELHNANKRDYYRKRLGGTLRLHRTALGGLAQAAAKAPLPLPVAAAAFALGDDFGRPVDEGRTAELAALATERGVLTLIDVDGDLRYGPGPIPSMGEHLAAGYTRKLDEGDRVALALAEQL